MNATSISFGLLVALFAILLLYKIGKRSAGIDDSHFGVPAGYKEVEPEMIRQKASSRMLIAAGATNPAVDLVYLSLLAPSIADQPCLGRITGKPEVMLRASIMAGVEMGSEKHASDWYHKPGHINPS